MRIETTRFGGIEVDESAVITLTHPIIGFQQFRRFTLLPGPQDSRLYWLQSVEAGHLAFLLMEPRQVVPDYRVKLAEEQLAELAVDTVDELDVYTLLVVPEDPSKIRTNLKAPVLINPKARLGKQAILDRADYPVQFFLAQAEREAGEAEEVVHARFNA